jgi:hypothetical protein
MPYEWKDEYRALARQFLNQHFGGAQGLTSTFPCMRGDYPWGDHRPDVIDSRIPAKNNTEYHGLERYANQYHATAQYDFAYQHWLMAAYWRRVDAECNNFTDACHSKAIEYCLKQALYNQSLSSWQENPVGPVPKPEEFDLSTGDLDKKEILATAQFEAVQEKWS